MSARWLFPTLLLVVVATLVEGMSFATARVLASRGVLYQPVSIDDYPGYLAIRDPVLGWPARPGAPPLAGAANEARDASGSRIVPSFPDPATPSCVSLYGDSFTWGAEVGDSEAWGNVLSQRMGCRIANYGVPGYGSDQALLRYRDNAPDRARFVVLAHLSENAMRNVNQYRAFLYPSATLGFKPRFALGAGGRLELVALPRIEPERIADFAREPQRFLEHEYFVPGGASGLGVFRFPYSAAVLGAFSHFHVRAKLRGDPWYAHFYRREHPSHALQVTAAIVREFVSDARARGQRPLPIVLPTKDDYAHRSSTGMWVYQPLVDALRDEGIELLDAGTPLAAAFGDEAPEAFFASDHPNARGNALLAAIVEGWLRERGF